MRTEHGWLSALALSLLLAACGRGGSGGDKPQAVGLTTLAVSERRSVLRYPGRVRASEDVSLAFRVSGTIGRMLVEEGERVEAGQLLAELEAGDYEVQLQAAEAEYARVKAEAERVIALYEDSGTTANAYDKAVYGLRQMEAKLRHSQDELSYTRLTAPFAGYVQSCLRDAHETVGAGSPVITLVSTDAPRVEISLSASDYARRSEFSAFSCSFDIFPGQTYSLSPIGIAPKANANQLYTMRLRLEAGEGPLPAPGMNTTVSIRLREGDEVAYAVPTGAILEEGGGSSLLLFSRKDSTVHSVPVTVIRLLGDGTSLVSSPSLKAGDEVVSSGVHHVREGERVRPMPRESETNVGGLL
ncbi:MAG: efflux RND transporter periplasmic adaptor subunit [Prevotellaceae bacterium]|nr:efflux RND transporter periplasmic adaptor subunit [Prevotellaceae bacterium]